MLYGFVARPGGKELPVDRPRIMRVRASDTGDAWQMTMAPDGFSRSASDAPADLVIEGPASDLYLSLWNRGPDSAVAVSGDQELLEVWHQNARIRWG